MAITAAQVKELREATGVGMMECKKALTENNGDMEQAVRWLREKGMARAANKAGRTAAEGVVEFAIAANGKEAAMLELNCETDFSGKNADFCAFAKDVAQLALEKRLSDIEALKACAWRGTTVAEQLAQLIAKVGENMSLRRLAFLQVIDGVVSGYNHMNGRIGALVALQGASGAVVEELGKEVAMHVAAAAPKYLNREQVDSRELEQEKEIARTRLREQGKPEAIIEKAMQGNINKFFSDVCLLEQPFIKEPKLNVTQYLKEKGCNAVPQAFARFQLGEGIEVKKENFADEVAAQLR